MRPKRTQLGKARAGDLAILVAFALVLLVGIPFPQPAETGLDGSWRIGISLLDFKQYPTVPIVFTYGFLGYLVRGAALPEAMASIIGFRLVVYVVYSGLALLYVSKAENRRVTLFGILALSLPNLLSLVKPYYQTEFQLALIPLLIIFIPSRRVSSLTRILIVCLLSGLVFHTKTSLFYYSFIPGLLYAICAGMTIKAGSASQRVATSIGWALAATLTSLLTLTGINLVATESLFPSFGLLKEISSGYSAGMSATGPAIEVLMAITTLLGICIASGYLYLTSDRPIRVFIFRGIPPLFFVLILSFKHGFVRQGHSPRFFVIQLVAFSILLMTAYHKENKIWRGQLPGMLTGLAVFSLLAGYFVSLVSVAKTTDFTSRIRQHLSYFSDPFNFGSLVDKRSRLNMKAGLLPKRILDEIGGDSIDVVPRELSIVYANKLKWAPRPTLQSYQGYTLKLDSLNASHIASKGPDYILFHQDSLDGKNQQFYSPQEHVAIVCNYQVIINDQNPLLGSYVLLKREKSTRCQDPYVDPTAVSTVLNRRTPIPVDHDVEMTLLSIDIRPNLLGKLLELLFRGPELKLVLEYPDKSTEIYRFSYTNSRDGLVILPLHPLNSSYQCLVRRSSSGCATTPPSAFTVISSSPRLFQHKIKARVINILFKDI